MYLSHRRLLILINSLANNHINNTHHHTNQYLNKHIHTQLHSQSSNIGQAYRQVESHPGQAKVLPLQAGMPQPQLVLLSYHNKPGQ